MDPQQSLTSPHILFFPLPLRGPIDLMLKLAELFCIQGFHVTFFDTPYTHQYLSCETDANSRFQQYPKFNFETLPDGLPEDHPRSTEHGFIEMTGAMEKVTMPLFRQYLVKNNGEGGNSGCGGENDQPPAAPVTCIVADAAFGWALDVAQQIGISLIYFVTISPGGLWTCLCLPKLIEAGEFPFTGEDLDVEIKCVPGMESFLRRRDLPDFYRTGNISDPCVQLFLKEATQLPRAQGLILNTFEKLDQPLLSQIRTLCAALYTIGPLRQHFKSRVVSRGSVIVREEDERCLSWLNKQSPNSVIYVSIGNHAVLSRDELTEFWHGLVNSGKQFLWVTLPGSIMGKEKEMQVLEELSLETKGKGFIARWASLEKILGHEAIGAFLTHSGWNSTLESMVEGKPMICWPYFADQQVNSRYVGEVWKIGRDMKDSCERVKVEKMVRDVMDERKDEFKNSIGKIMKLAKESVGENGSSYCDFDHLVKDIRSMSLK